MVTGPDTALIGFNFNSQFHVAFFHPAPLRPLSPLPRRPQPGRPAPGRPAAVSAHLQLIYNLVAGAQGSADKAHIEVVRLKERAAAKEQSLEKELADLRDFVRRIVDEKAASSMNEAIVAKNWAYGEHENRHPNAGKCIDNN